MARAVFFDVDGVLIDSVGAKGEAFVAAFSDFPESADLIRRLHRSYGGIPRGEKIEMIRHQLLRLPSDPMDVTARIEAFSEKVVDLILAAPQMPGATQTLETLSQQYELHAVSATPTDELVTILTHHGWAPLFHSILGGSTPKTESLRLLIEARDYDARVCCMVGDSPQDREAARANRVPFVLVRGSIDPASDDFAAISRLESLPPLVRAIDAVPS